MEDPKSIKILTTYRINDCPLWDRNVAFLSYIPKSRKFRNRILKEIVRIYDDIKVILELLKERKNFDVLITYRDRANNVFAVIQAIFGKKIHHVMLNALWSLPQGNIATFLRKVQLKLLLKGVDIVAVFASHESLAYEALFGLPRDKFIFIPYFYTPQATLPTIKNGDYIFAGGQDAYRDYQMLMDAVKDIDIKCIIATQSPENLKKLNVPKNVLIARFPQDEYFQKMAECRLTVVPSKKGYFRSTGQRTYLNSMLMGKPTVISDTKGAFDYMNNWEEGIIVPPGDLKALKEAIQWVLDPVNEQKVREMTEKASKRARNYSIENTMGQILLLAEKVARKDI